MVKQADRFIHTNVFPDKTIDLLDEAGAIVGARMDAAEIVDCVSEQIATAVHLLRTLKSNVQNYFSTTSRSGRTLYRHNLAVD